MKDVALLPEFQSPDFTAPQIALNEQFMVSSVSHSRPPGDLHSTALAHTTASSTSTLDTSLTTRTPPTTNGNHHRAHSKSQPSILSTPYQTQPVNASEKELKLKEAESKRKNRVLLVLMRRLGSSKTFGENVIFMLNRISELMSPLDYGGNTHVISSQQQTPLRACASSFSFLKFYTFYLPLPGRRSISTPTI